LYCGFSSRFSRFAQEFRSFYVDRFSFLKARWNPREFWQKSPPTSKKCRFEQTLFYKGAENRYLTAFSHLVACLEAHIQGQNDGKPALSSQLHPKMVLQGCANCDHFVRRKVCVNISILSNETHLFGTGLG
jgi:hypothetical protein